MIKGVTCVGWMSEKRSLSNILSLLFVELPNMHCYNAFLYCNRTE